MWFLVYEERPFTRDRDTTFTLRKKPLGIRSKSDIKEVVVQAQKLLEELRETRKLCFEIADPCLMWHECQLV